MKSLLLPGFTPFHPCSSFPDKVNRGHPSSVINKQQNSSCDICIFSLFFLCNFFSACHTHAVDFCPVVYGWVTRATPINMSLREESKRISEKVLNKWMTLWWLSHPEGWRPRSLCAFQCNLWSRWLESRAESSRSQPACHRDDVSWLPPSFS